jgi:hypothetical protein
MTAVKSLDHGDVQHEVDSRPTKTHSPHSTKTCRKPHSQWVLSRSFCYYILLSSIVIPEILFVTPPHFGLLPEWAMPQSVRQFLGRGKQVSIIDAPQYLRQHQKPSSPLRSKTAAQFPSEEQKEDPTWERRFRRRLCWHTIHCNGKEVMLVCCKCCGLDLI